MKKTLSLLGFTFLFSVGVGICGDTNRPVGFNPVHTMFRPSDDRMLVSFSTTTPSGGTAVLLLGSHTFVSFNVPAGINFSTGGVVSGLSSSTKTTYGGRAYSTFQVVNSSVNIYVGLGDPGVGTTTHPYLTQGQWFSPDDPVAYQGRVYVTANGTYTVAGFYWTEQNR